MTTASSDVRYMRQALRLARQGEGGTRPNPPVGAVVVQRGRVVGRGYHARAGTAHAEIHALAAAGKRARGGTLYVTLEPCSTWGRTSPCTEAILAAGIRRVVACVVDPNPKHAGRGFVKLRRAGIAVTKGICMEEGQELLAPFARWVTQGMPYVTLKLAMTLDGRIADRLGHSRWISSTSSRDVVQELRRRADAVMVGAGTTLADDPALSCRAPRALPLLRVIVDSRGRTPPRAQVFRDGAGQQTIVATTDRCSRARQEAYRRSGAQIWILPAKRMHVSLKALLRRLGREGVLHVVCEGGGKLAAGMVHARLINQLWLFVAPKTLGGSGIPVVGGAGWLLGKAPGFAFRSCTAVGPDMLLIAEPDEKREA